MKVISRRKSDCSHEVQLLSLCQGHSNIVRLYEVLHDEVITGNLTFFNLPRPAATTATATAAATATATAATAATA